MTLSRYMLIQGDATKLPLADKSVDLVCGSPPYEAQRLYAELMFRLRGQAWVDWMVQVIRECLRVSRGLVAMVLEGFTRNYRWSATPALLMADLHRAGIHLRKPPVFHRVGIPGSGGPDFLRNDWEFVICATNGGRLPWSCNTAMGQPPKWAPGGPLTHQLKNGRKVARLHTKTMVDGTRKQQGYCPPKIANPGNVLRLKVGGGLMGHKLATKNEACYPESLPNFFIRSFCPPNGTVFDPFCGSGTTIAAALKAGRNGIGMDIRESQLRLSARRLADVSPLFTAGGAA